MDILLLLSVVAFGAAFALALVTPNAGEDKFLANIVNKTAPENWILKLYKNNVTPAEGDTAGSYTEADFTGYSAKTLTGASWNISNPTASYAQQSFTSSAGQAVQQIYGYFVVGASDGVIRIAERFPNGPYPISNDQDVVRVTPSFTLD